jgi:hypothetical protein
MPIPAFERNFKGAFNLAFWLVHNGWFNPNDLVTIDGNILVWFREKIEKEKNKEVHYYYLNYVKVSTFIEQEDCFEILLPHNVDFNYCHLNFAVCKELCHVLTDEGEFKSRDPFQQLFRALEICDEVIDPYLANLLTKPHLPLSEDFCFLLAIELLIPIGRRNEIIAQFKSDRAKKRIIDEANLLNVARSLKIPKKVLTFFVLSDYHDIFNSLGGDNLPKGSIPDKF